MTASDDFLTTLVDLVNYAPGAEMSLSINVPGGVVTGILVSYQAWAQANAEQAREGITLPDDISEEVRSMWEDGGLHSLFESRRDQEQERVAAMKQLRRLGEEGALPQEFADYLEDNADKPKHLHLKEARFISGAEPYPESAQILWRGRISDVSGWTLSGLRP